jgi:transcription-repair coupling factor (superfamily II helicase)
VLAVGETHNKHISKRFIRISLSFVAAGFFQSSNKPSVIVVNDKEEAAYLYNDMTGLLPENDVFFFPSSFKRSVQ